MKTQLKKSLKKFFKILKKTFIFLILVLFFFFALYFLNEYFVVQEIKIKGISENTSLNGIASYKNRNILFLSEKEIENRIISENSYVDKVYVNKELPKTLSVLVSIHKNIAQLKVSNGFFNLSEEGRIISKVRKSTENIPIINYYQLFNYHENQAGDFITYKDIKTALFILKKALNLGIKADSIDINGLSMIVLNFQERKVFFTTEKDKEVQIYELDQIIHSLKIKGQDFKKLDLRFKKPIIVFY